MANKRSKLGDRSARHDAAYLRAKQEGFAARAVYKLEELDERFSLLRSGRSVLDLGCWPGSWMQYAASRVGEGGRVVGIDLRPVELALPSWCEAFVADVEELDPQVLVERFGPFDVVLSDMAPKTIGDTTTDAIRSEALFERALAFAEVVLRPGGHFAGKVFQGAGFQGLMVRMRGMFQQLKPFHTKATRAGSAEHYLVGQGRRAGSPPA
jgi:23S rRNA (uridine2552-2'-O)-methyltransferase